MQRIVTYLMYDRLIAKDENLAYVPQLAKSWVEAADGMARTFTLKPGVDWLALYPDTENAYLLDAVERAELVSDMEGRFVMKRPDPDWLPMRSRSAAPWFAPFIRQRAQKGASATGFRSFKGWSHDQDPPPRQRSRPAHEIGHHAVTDIGLSWL